jgi:hypothetical protein
MGFGFRRYGPLRWGTTTYLDSFYRPFLEKNVVICWFRQIFFFDDNWFRHWGWRLISVRSRSRLPFCNFLDCYQCPV